MPIRFVPSRGDAGGLNMADGFARASNGLGVAFTSTGTGSGNAAGVMVEALNAGSPALHLTGQVERCTIAAVVGPPVMFPSSGRARLRPRRD